MMEIDRSTLWVVFGVLGVVGCADGDDARGLSVPWQDDNYGEVIGPDGQVIGVARPTGDSCLAVGQEFPDLDCLKPQQDCAGGFDVLVSDDKVLETLCYPKAETLTPAEIEAKDGIIAQNENNAVIGFPDDASAVIEGDLAVDANNVVIYGHGPDSSILDGDLKIDGNNSIVRGIRITGDVTVVFNNTTLFFCAIEGNVVIEGNNTTLAGCDVFGSVTLRGNNTRLAGNRIAGELVDEGVNTSCEGNLLATDDDGNFKFEDSEVGEALSCAP